MNQPSNIQIFTTPNCSFCRVVKNYFQSLNIDFEEVDLSQNQQGFEWLIEKTGQAGVPVTVFNNSQFVIGWQKQLLDDQLRQLALIK
ncbi:MAG: glutaredoxin family protein [Candidatus Saccharibacteria bacterium]|nr:glutaredoxin family protein [Candidatus Saccharibacteria bacterium]